MGRSATPKLSVLLWIAGAGLYPMLSFGVGLSEIQLDSRLNQPLRARIEVLDISDADWTHVQTRLNRQSAPDTAALRPELLGSMTVRTVQDAQHRHFIEIRSTEPLAEPLFDLPVEIAGPTGHVIRNYAVLLDPPSTGDDARRVAETQAPGLAERSASSNDFASADGAATADAATTGVMSGSGPAVADDSTAQPAQSNTTRQHSNSTHSTRQRHGARQRHAAHSSGAARPIDASGAAGQNGTQTTAGPVTGRLGATTSHSAASISVASNSAVQQELLNQLESLQKTLTQMQQTISAQNAQIADLTAKVARAESRASSSTTSVDSSRTARPSGSSSAASADVDTGDADSADDAGPAPRPYFWLTVVLGATTLAAIVSAVFVKWRTKRAARKLAASRGPSAQQPWSAERQPSTERQVLASNGPEYQGGSARRAGAVGSLTTPAAQQKQMEADGRVQIDWDKDLWNKPEWAQLFGEQPGTTEQPTAAPTQPAAEGPVADLLDLTDSMAEQVLGEDTAKLPEANHTHDVDLTHLTDLASLSEPDHAHTSDSSDDTEVLHQQEMPDAPRLRLRRAGG